MNECTSQAAAGIVSFRDHVMCWFSTITYVRTYRAEIETDARKQAGPKKATQNNELFVSHPPTLHQSNHLTSPLLSCSCEVTVS